MTEIVYSAGLQRLMMKRPDLVRRIEHVVLECFPELGHVRFGRASRSAYYDPRTGTIRLTGRSSTYVIGHEIVHFMQDGRYFPAPYPKGERSCDVYLFARAPGLVADVWEAQDRFYLGNTAKAADLRQYFNMEEGQRMIHEVCAEALRLRAAGRRDYIRWAERAIDARIEHRATRYS